MRALQSDPQCLWSGHNSCHNQSEFLSHSPTLYVEGCTWRVAASALYSGLVDRPEDRRRSTRSASSMVRPRHLIATTCFVINPLFTGLSLVDNHGVKNAYLLSCNVGCLCRYISCTGLSTARQQSCSSPERPSSR